MRVNNLDTRKHINFGVLKIETSLLNSFVGIFGHLLFKMSQPFVFWDYLVFYSPNDVNIYHKIVEHKIYDKFSSKYFNMPSTIFEVEGAKISLLYYKFNRESW